MTIELEEKLYKSAAAKVSIIFASIGLLTAFVLNLLLGTIVLALNFPIPVILGLIFLYLSAYIYGQLGGAYIYRAKSNNYKIECVGILIAFSTVLTMSLAGSSYYFIKAINFNNFGASLMSAGGSYLFKPIFWICFFGLIPSVILGIYWGKVFRNKINKITQ